MSAEEHRKERDKDRLADDSMSIHTIFMAAAIAGGKDANKADAEAARAIDLIRKRFVE